VVWRRKLTKERALASWIKTVYYRTKKSNIWTNDTFRYIHLSTIQWTQSTTETETREARFVKWWKENIQHITVASNPLYNAFAQKKVKKLTQQAFTARTCFRIRPNMEYEIEAELFMNSFAIAPKVLLTHQLVQGTMLMYCITSKTTSNVKQVIWF
jgi:Xaa-Pro aminopeptidase